MANKPNLTQPITERTTGRSSRASSNNSDARLVWRTGSLIALLAVLFLVIRPDVGWTQTPDVVNYFGVFDGTCSTDSNCCQSWQIIINDPTTDIYFQPLTDGPSDDCMSVDCWEAQSGAGLTFTHPSGFVWGILFSNSTQEVIGPFPDTIYVSICAPVECWQHFPYFNWSASDGSSGQFAVHLCPTGVDVSNCGSCDRVDAADNGCYTSVCFMHFSNNPLSTFTLHFNPPLPPCNMGSHTGKLCDLPWLPNINMEESGWPYTTAGSDGSGDDSELVFTAVPGYSFTSCGTVCMEIPNCVVPHNTTITVTDGYECSDSGASISILMKQADGGGIGEQIAPEQNYPNPVDASTGFKTTIPFTTTAQGIALIRIVDQTGAEVLKDNEEVTYSGQHFFYFTASALPAGTYYYQIEFPQGVVIQNKTMLVVK